jgi:hypothetical protein
MLEVLKQAIDYIENVPDDRDSVGHIDRGALILAINQAIKELESQELKQINVKEFVHMVEGKEDLIGRPVYFAQWPNGNTHPPQSTWVGLTDEEICMFSMWLDSKPDATVFTAIEARLKELNT